MSAAETQRKRISIFSEYRTWGLTSRFYCPLASAACSFGAKHWIFVNSRGMESETSGAVVGNHEQFQVHLLCFLVRKRVSCISSQRGDSMWGSLHWCGAAPQNIRNVTRYTWS